MWNESELIYVTFLATLLRNVQRTSKYNLFETLNINGYTEKHITGIEITEDEEEESTVSFQERTSTKVPAMVTGEANTTDYEGQTLFCSVFRGEQGLI